MEPYCAMRVKENEQEKMMIRGLLGSLMRIPDIWKSVQNGYIELWLSLFLANLPHLSILLTILIPIVGITDLKTLDG